MKNFYHKSTAWIATLPVLLLPMAAHAQLDAADTYLTDIGEGIGNDATTNDLPTLIGNFIAVLLSVLGIVFVVLIVYSGFNYLTAMGDDDKVKTAKKNLTNAVIGLVIIIAAYAIASFVIDALQTAATG